MQQCQEVFTLCDDDTERRSFLQALAALADFDCGATVVLGIRADFYPRCAEHPLLAAALQNHQLLVTPMNAEELRAAIIRPAERAGLRLEPGLVETILADLGEEPGSLPLLSHALSATWKHKQGRTLTCAGYRDAGGVRQAIGQTADAVYGALTQTEQAIAKDIFLRLTALGEGTEDTRRRVQPSELVSRQDNTQVQRVLNALAADRLITLGENSIEVAHEALIRKWPQLREWLDEDRDGLRLARGLTTAARDWTTSDRDKDLLYRGARLVDVRAWIQRTQPRLSADEDEFLTTSIRTQEQEEPAAQRRARRLHQLVACLAVALLLAITTTVFFVKERNNAVQGQNLGISRKVAGDAIALRITKPALAAQLALAAFLLVPTAEARGALISTLGPLDGSRQLRAETGDAVRSVVFSPNGHLLAAASQDNFAYLWELTDPPNFGQPIARLPHDNQVRNNQVRSVAFRPDGLVLASTSRDGKTKLWDLTNPRQPIELTTLSDHTKSVVGVAFSPDGHTLATASEDHHVKLWNITNPRYPSELATLSGHNREVVAVTFSPDGHTLATASYDQTAKLWNITNPSKPTELTTLPQGTGFVNSVAFSPNGRILATAHRDTTARLWDITAPRHPTALAVLAGHTGPVNSVKFSPDGHTSPPPATTRPSGYGMSPTPGPSPSSPCPSPATPITCTQRPSARTAIPWPPPAMTLPCAYGRSIKTALPRVSATLPTRPSPAPNGTNTFPICPTTHPAPDRGVSD
jgi:WD40 repeat protein